MTLHVLAPLTIRFDRRVIQFEPGAVFTATDAQAQRIIRLAPNKVQAIDLPLDPPAEPLQPGWLVCYRDRAGRLAGGVDDRARGTVQACTWDGHAWTVALTNGETVPLTIVSSVAKTDHTGRVLSAWMVREHGHNGEG